ncbi:MAG: CBS domain-containing protein, partial [Leptolyngbyaceae bacterium]|nr:CBS domain-containing protein [Leptolyngbyaceae bacterium]
MLLNPEPILDLKQAIDISPLVVSPDTLLREAIALMSNARGTCSLNPLDSTITSTLQEARASCVLVMEGARLVGIVTERDLVRLMATGMNSEQTRISEVMTRQIIILNQSQCQDLLSILSVFRRYQIRHLPIVDDQEQLVGLVTHDSIRAWLRPTDLLRFRLLSEVMTSQVVKAPASISVLRLAQLMAEHRVSCVVIVESETSPGSPEIDLDSALSAADVLAGSPPLVYPVGMVTERDLVQFQALELDFLKVSAQDVMSTPLFCLGPQDSLWLAHQQMLERRVQRLVVTGDQGELLGIVTQTSLLQTLDPVELHTTVNFLQEKVLQLEAEKIELLQNRNLELTTQVEEQVIALQEQSQRDQLLTIVAARIRQSLELGEILNTAVTEIRQLLQADRVIIYRVYADGTGSAIAEALNERLPSILNRVFPAEIFPETCYQAYIEGRIYQLSNTETAEIPPCLLGFLQELGVQAKLVVPIIQQGTLWGLMIAHQMHPRQWHPLDVKFLEKLATQLAIAVHQADLHQQAQLELCHRQQAERALRQLNAELESRVQQRTAELARTVDQLQLEICDRKQAESNLRVSEKKYRNVVDTAKEVIFQIDAQGAWTFLNPAWTSITGWNIEESLGTNFLEHVYPEDKESNASHVQALLTGQTKNCQYEFRHLAKAGIVQWLEVSALPIQDWEGQVIGATGTLNDITDRKQSELETRKAFEEEKALVTLKSRFIAMASHEFRTPLTIIASSAGLLESYGHNLEDTEKQETFQSIQNAVKHMNQLLEDVLLLNQAESGKLEFKPAFLNVEQFCQELVSEIQRNSAQHTILFSPQYHEMPKDTAISLAFLDQKLLRQILTNLLSNAIKYSPQGGNVYFDIVYQAKFLVFSIRDQGIGIPVEAQAQLFEAFHRAEN